MGRREIINARNRGEGALMKMLPMILICTLTHPVIATDLQRNEQVKLAKDDRVQVIQVKGPETVVYTMGGYYQIKSDELMCR